MLLSNDVFQAKDKFGNKYFYKFYGLDIDDESGCQYIKMQNLSTNTVTNVEHLWFKQREIKLIKKHMKIKVEDKVGIISELSSFLSDIHLVISFGDDICSATSKIVKWSDVELLD